MTNSLDLHLRGYFHALFKDIAWLYSKHKERERDLSRLFFVLETYGIRSILVEFPAIDKHFTKCLDEGQYTRSGLFLCGRTRRGSNLPRFLESLFLLVFHPDGKLRKDPSIEAILALRQVFCGLKKLRLPFRRKDLDNEVTDFFAVEADLRQPTLFWSEDCLNLPDADDVHFRDIVRVDEDQLDLFGNGEDDSHPTRSEIDHLQLVADVVASQYGDLHEEEPHILPKHGPGVVSNHRRGESKYDFPEWPLKLQSVFPFDHYGLPNSGFCDDQSVGPTRFLNHEKPSKLIAVPKTLKGPRLIAAEPSQHQWIQQLVWNQLETRTNRTLLRESISFRSQQPNQWLARAGSIDGSFATIDLSAASDRLSCHTVERMFRKNHTLLERVHACRTRWLYSRINPKQPTFVVLRKFGPMGSAVTFPLQSIVYAIVATAAVSFIRKCSLREAARLVQVFGDDIVIPDDGFELMCSYLKFLQLKVNTSKSFHLGRFRESCGTDWYNGEKVSPTYLLNPRAQSASATESYQNIEVINNFHLNGWWNIGDYLQTTCDRVKHLIPIIGITSGATGFKSYCGYKKDHLKRRWNPDLHCNEVRHLLLTNKEKKLPESGANRLLRYFNESPDPMLNWSSGVVDKPVLTARPVWGTEDKML